MSKDITEKIQATIKAQGRTNRWVYRNLGMTAPTFSSRLKQGDWRLTELQRLSKLLGIEII